ncbi:hypothetical protein IU459_15975 [Nocardia amamiensis]|uniref:Uncharacterized protein n=1 Tax=Nocardia amamiensis TaxID=404578 RepID=A0ABS0CSA7_9NOCA|nr:hypothetical protein [Nocardia amamiensis]MBF6299030.1 hypothetical protein [Nocardia amamiensis]
MNLPSITCPACGSVSYHPADIEQRYCGRCHMFHSQLGAPAPLSGADVLESELGDERVDEWLRTQAAIFRERLAGHLDIEAGLREILGDDGAAEA